MNIVLDTEHPLKSEVASDLAARIIDKEDEQKSTSPERQQTTSSLKKVLSMQKALSQQGSSQQVDKPDKADIDTESQREARLDELMSATRIEEVKRDHEAYLTVFIANLEKEAKQRNKHVGAV